ncbi:MAG: protein DA1 [Xanthobacteraceae bacterium]
MTTPMFNLPPGARCELEGCGRVLEGAIVCDSRGHYFCGAHGSALRSCRFCGRGFVPRNNGADRCADCTRKAVTSIADAQTHFQRAVSWFARHGLQLASPLPRIELQDTLPRQNMLGYTEKLETGRGWFKGATMTAPRIVMRNALPPEIFLIVAAHELGHAWLTTQGVVLSEQMEEGICTWLSHRFVRGLGTPDAGWLAQQIESQKDPLYGTGYRRFAAIAKDASPAELPRILHSRQSELRH